MSCCDQNKLHWSCARSAMSANEWRRSEKPNNEHLACIVLLRPRNPSSHHKHCHHHWHYVSKYFIIRRVLWSISELVVIKGILTLSFIQLLRSLTPFFANIFDSCDRTLVYPEIKYMISQYISYCLVRTQRLIANKKNLVNKVVHWEACKRNGWLSGQHDL